MFEITGVCGESVRYLLLNCYFVEGGSRPSPTELVGVFIALNNNLPYKSTPRNFLARMPTMKDTTATLILMMAISAKRALKGWSCATLV